MAVQALPVPASPGIALAHADAVVAAMATLADLAGEAARWSGDDRRAMLDRLDRAVDGLASVRAAVLVAERESGTWHGAGDRSFEAWRSRTCRTGQRAAAAQMRQAEQLHTVPWAAAAVAAGRISLEHAAIMARVASTGTPAQQSAALSAAGHDHLLGLAEREDAGTFATSVAWWAASIDPVALERDHQAQRAERFLHLTDTPRGTFIKGRVDSMAGHRLNLALEALGPRPAAEDDRDPGQRRADALDTIASRVLALPDTKPGGHVPPQISMILTEETWIAARAERDRRRHAPTTDRRSSDGVAADTITRSTGHPPATLEDGTPVPASELAAVMCDCQITRVVIDADGVPLDLGRSERLFTGPQRRAVIVRDRECAWPACHMPARWCEIHHISWWERDAGPTSVENGVLMCTFHHHEVHRRHLIIGRVSVEPSRGSPPRRRPWPGAEGPHEAEASLGRTRSAVVRVRYEFRDHAGRTIGEPPTSARVDDDGRTRSITPAGVGVQPPCAPPPEAGRQSVPAPGRGSSLERTDRLELEWTTDPVTGSRAPAFFGCP